MAQSWNSAAIRASSRSRCAGGSSPQVARLDRHVDVLEHDLHGLLLLDCEDRPQHLVAADDDLQRALQEPQIEVERSRAANEML